MILKEVMNKSVTVPETVKSGLGMDRSQKWPENGRRSENFAFFLSEMDTPLNFTYEMIYGIIYIKMLISTHFVCQICFRALSVLYIELMYNYFKFIPAGLISARMTYL